MAVPDAARVCGDDRARAVRAAAAPAVARRARNARHHRVPPAGRAPRSRRDPRSRFGGGHGQAGRAWSHRSRYARRRSGPPAALRHHAVVSGDSRTEEPGGSAPARGALGGAPASHPRRRTRMTLMRLQRALARAGVTSRRKAEDLIRAGRVRVDGEAATIGMSADPDTQKITVDGRPVRGATRTTWLALNKPLGYVVSRSDPEGRRTVFGLLPKVPGLTYVGRLDVMTSGLLLLTTDGAAAHRLMHPRFAVPRTYWLGAHGLAAQAVQRALAGRIVIDDRPVRIVASRVRPAGGGVEVEVTLAEGRQRIVRRLAEQLGLKVEWLHRVAYGPVRLGKLPEGRHRALTAHEIREIERLHGPA